jgi:Na+/H+ antiporter NhaD/arsenite permease-like protein
MMPSAQEYATLAIIILTIIGVAAGRVPVLRMNRATIALVGATALVAIGSMSLDEAYASLDLDTLLLLLAMMIVNANLRLAGFFGLVGRWIVERARSERQLLLFIMLASGALSALFLNDTIVIMFTPLVLELVLALGRNPIPYLMGLATAANIGSVAAITGNPQNMLIGVSSGIPFITFSQYLAPVAIIGLLLAWAVIVLVYRHTLRGSLDPHFLLSARVYPPLLYKGLASVAVLIIALLAGVHIPLAALGAAALLLITRRLKPEKVFQEIDWSLLVFFAGLFVVTGAVVETGLGQRLFAWLLPLADNGVAALSGVSLILSNLISNVPAVMLFRPFVPQMNNPQMAWLTLAMATTLAGNLTLLGSVANLIVAETAARHGVRLTFREYLKTGVLITLLTLAVGVVWLSIVG